MIASNFFLNKGYKPSKNDPFFWDMLFGFMFISLAFSIDLHIPILNFGFNLRIPTELIALILTAYLFFSYFFSFILLPNKASFFKLNQISFDKLKLDNISFCLICYILILFFSCFFSTIALVSFKSFIIRFCFICSAYFFALRILNDYKKQSRDWREYGYRCIEYLSIALCFVGLYVIYRRFTYVNFNVDRAFTLVKPFFNDHTQLGMLLALLIPFQFIRILAPMPLRLKLRAALIFVFLLLALYFTYSRGAQLSLIISLILIGIIKLKMQLRTKIYLFSSLFIIALLSLFVLKNYAIDNNIQKSSYWLDNYLSVLNQKKEISSLERQNRWACAFRIAKDYPCFGSGMGTYQFVYGTYQLPNQMTAISTLNGDGGTCHNEYLLALSNTGILGLSAFMLLILSGFVCGIKTYLKTRDSRDRDIILALMMALMTYFIHAFVNNFLDTDKAAIPIFFFFALLSMYSQNIKEKTCLI